MVVFLGITCGCFFAGIFLYGALQFLSFLGEFPTARVRTEAVVFSLF